MGSKPIVFLGLLLTLFLLISSQVLAARDLAETTNSPDRSEATNVVGGTRNPFKPAYPSKSDKNRPCNYKNGCRRCCRKF